VDSLKLFGVAILIAAMAVESLAQVCLKVGAAGGPGILIAPYSQFFQNIALFQRANVWKILGVVFYGLEIFLWTSVLHLLDVSVAFPMGSLCFVGVALLSKIFLGEVVGPVRAGGVVCIIAGTVLMTL